MQEILAKKVMLRIKYTKVPKTAPVFLTKEEIKRLFQAVENPKHLLILELLYSAGLRVSEVLNLRRQDFEFERGMGWVRKGKGRKDRPFIIAKVLVPRLQVYLEKNCTESKSYVFTGYYKQKLHVRSVQEIIKKAAKKARITKNVHPHSLRHSYATHLIENGYDLNTVQPLMGHQSAETTMGYVHMASPTLLKVESPYDSLEREKK